MESLGEQLAANDYVPAHEEDTHQDQQPRYGVDDLSHLFPDSPYQ